MRACLPVPAWRRQAARHALAGALVLQPGFMLADPLSPVGPVQDGIGLRTSVPDETPEQAAHLGHGEGQKLGGEIALVLSPRGRPCGARRGRRAPAWRA